MACIYFSMVATTQLQITSSFTVETSTQRDPNMKWPSHQVTENGDTMAHGVKAVHNLPLYAVYKLKSRNHRVALQMTLG